MSPAREDLPVALGQGVRIDMPGHPLHHATGRVTGVSRDYTTAIYRIQLDGPWRAYRSLHNGAVGAAYLRRHRFHLYDPANDNVVDE